MDGAITKFSRTSTPKSKGGCATCRSRRVKCDEGRPECIRCVKAKLTCGGYNLVKARSRKYNRHSVSFKHALIKPKTLSLQQDAASSLASQAPSSTFLGESEIENSYFRYFQETNTTGLDGTWGWSLWNSLMLQTSHQEPFVRHSIIAIGALLKSHESAYLAGVRPRSVVIPYVAKLHRSFAISKYDTAVKSMRKAISVGTSSPRQTLLGCILVVCFEMLIGNSHLAIKHAHSGTSILQQWRAQTITPIQEQRPLLSPAPLVVEDEIVEAFRSLSIQITTLGDDSSATYDKKTTNYHCVTSTAPLTCSDLRETHVYLNEIVCHIYHFITTIPISSEYIAPSKRLDGVPLIEDASVITNMAIYRTAFEITENVRAQQAQFAAEIANWTRLFKPLFESLCIKQEDDEAAFSCASHVAAMMQMQAIATTILTAGVLITNEMEYDKFNSQFQELVDLAALIVKLRQQAKKSNSWVGGPWIDIGLTPQLFVVVTRCRDPVIRRMAIKLLEGWYIEGFWDPALIAQIGLFIMEVEEEGLEDVDFGVGKKSIIPERARAVISRISEDSQKRSGIAKVHASPNFPTFIHSREPTSHAANMDTLNVSHQREYMAQMARQREALLAASARAGQPPAAKLREDVLSTFKKQAKRAEKGRMQALRSSETQIQSTFVPPAYAACVASVAELTKMGVNELRLETHHRGRFVLLRALAGPSRMTALVGVGEDEEGRVVRVQVYQQRDDSEVWKVGGVVVVKEPYFKESGDGDTGIRVDHVGDVMALPANHPLVPEKWRKGVDAVLVREWIDRAAEAMKGERYWEALDQCKAALLASPPPTLEEDSEIKLKLGAAYLRVGYFESAESAIEGLELTPESLKIKAEAFYNLARYDECIESLGKLPDQDSALLEKAKIRLVEQQTGAYNFRSIFAELSALNPPTVDRATFIGPVDIRVSPGKGRGLFTTRAVEAGELLVCEKAFAYSFFDQSAPAEMHKTKLSMVFNTEEGSIIFGTLGTLITEAVQKVARNPFLHDFVSSLYHGSYKAPTVNKVDDHPVIDTFLIERIISHNCFGCPPTSLLAHVTPGPPKRAYSSGLWPLCATLNHSCLPTARRAFIGDLQVVRATRALPANTELVWAYHEVSEDPVQTRQALANWGFVCSCGLCAEAARTPEKVRRRRELLRTDLRACVMVKNPDAIDVPKAERLVAAADATYKAGPVEAPRESLCGLQLMVARVHKNRGEAAKVVGAALGVLRLLGFEVKGAQLPRGKEEFEVVRWGSMAHGVVETWVQLWVAYATVAPELCADAERCARICYKICVGEDETFDDSYGKKARKAMEDGGATAP
ncbi:hypothetical protein V500_08923 [Pseudogymnoascus sp. VKM F-4518 (FW-2643)]|nr:hypothetical protein V500_08923 [Pseudogymnoascus sp. VKM F-4518 (FW-2643)]